jgi:hypothetical protein
MRTVTFTIPNKDQTYRALARDLGLDVMSLTHWPSQWGDLYLEVRGMQADIDRLAAQLGISPDADDDTD